MKPRCGRSDGIFLFRFGIYGLVALRLRMSLSDIVRKRRRAVFVYDRKRICRRGEINIPYPVFKPFAYYDLHVLSQLDMCSLFKFSAWPYESCPHIWFSSRREEKDLHFRFAIFFDPRDTCRKHPCIVEYKQVTFSKMILDISEYFVFSCP